MALLESTTTDYINLFWKNNERKLILLNGDSKDSQIV